MVCNDLTIVVPNYNKDKYLNECIRSIYNQTLVPVEVLVVDDCSTDSSLDILAELTKEFESLVIVSLLENKGVSNARNVGISRCRTKYISFLDSDDYIYNRKKIENEMQMMSNSDNSLVYSNVVRVNEFGELINGNQVYYNFMNLKGRCFAKLLEPRTMIYGPFNYIVPTKLVKRVGAFSFEYNLYEDYDLLIRLSLVCKFIPTNRIGYAYRYTSNGLSKAKKEEHKNVLKTIKETYYPILTISQKYQLFQSKVVLKIFWLYRRLLNK